MIQRFINLFLIVILLLTMIFIAVGTVYVPTADVIVSTNNNYDVSDIDDDLVNLDYERIYSEYDDLTLISFAEYCFSDNDMLCGSYGLYLYIYNPNKINILLNSDSNTVNIAVSYDSSGNPLSYANKSIKFLDKSDNGLFYKFKIIDTSDVLTNASKSNDIYKYRRYDVSGVQLFNTTTNSLVDGHVGGTYIYSGYAAGFGSDSDVSTLNCKVTELETIQLDVHSTYYRPDGTNGNGNKQDTLYSVYFAVPKRFSENYGDLYSITAEWLYARLNPMFVVADKTVSDSLNSVAGQVVSTMNSPYGFATYLEYNGFMDGDSYWFYWEADKMFNLNKDVPYYDEHGRYETDGGSVSEAGFAFNELINTLYFTFYADLSSGQSIADYNVSSEEIIDYMEDYSANSSGSKVLDKYSTDLFEYYDNQKTVKTITKNDSFSLTDSKLGYSLWDFIWGVKQSEIYDNIQAIYKLKDSDFQGAVTTSDNLYISESDYNELLDFYNLNKSDNDVYLFRFAVDSNYSADYATVFKHADNADTFDELFDGKNNRAYYASGMAVYLDFDIIELTYERDGVYTVIPVVSNPIDIVPDLTPPTTEPDPDDGWPWWVYALIILGCILLLPIIIMLLPHIATFCIWLVKILLKLIWFIISLPFRLVAWIVHKVRGDG